jgi:hypothetical protein
VCVFVREAIVLAVVLPILVSRVVGQQVSVLPVLPLDWEAPVAVVLVVESECHVQMGNEGCARVAYFAHPSAGLRAGLY